MKNKIFSNYLKEYNNFLVWVVFVSILVAGVAAIFFSMVLNVSDAASRGIELNPVWLIRRYPIFLIAAGLITFFGAIIGGYVLADWLWLDFLNEDLDQQISKKRGSLVGFVLAIGMTYFGVTAEYPKYMDEVVGLTLFPFVALFSTLSGYLIGKYSVRSDRLILPAHYDIQPIKKDFNKNRKFAFKLNLSMLFVFFLVVAVVIYVFNVLKVIQSGFLLPWSPYDNWGYTLFLLLNWMALFSFAGYFTANRIIVLVVEKKINKRWALCWGFSIGMLFGFTVWLGLSNSFIGSIHWWKGPYSTICLILFGCMNAYTAMQVWKQIQKSK